MKIALLALSAILGLAVFPAASNAHEHGFHHGHPWHDWDDRPSFYFDVDVWRHGYWDHGWRGNRLGWWWVVPPRYSYYYAEPVYPYPDYDRPTTVIIQQSPPPVTGVPPQQYWYYCKNPKGYYPYVEECRDDWRKVPVTPQDK